MRNTIIAAVCASLACGREVGVPEPDPPSTLVAEFGIEPAVMTLRQAHESLFVAKFRNWSYDTAMTWTTAPESIAAITRSGKVTGVRPGRAVLTAYPTRLPQLRLTREIVVVP